MRKTALGACLVLALLFGSAVGANATSHLEITGWWGSATSAAINAYDPAMGWESATYGCGAFQWTLDGQVGGTRMYCLDVWHSFNWGQHWDVDILVIPPDPSPPYNTDQAAWIYQTYGKNPTSDRMAQGVQLALWEICTEVDWMAHWNPTTWHDPGDEADGDFYLGSVNATALGHATAILTDLYDETELGYYCYYYRPTDAQHVGQGQMGDVPEPGTLLLLGLGLASMAGVAWRRRHRS